jgi:hypothetical protein
MKIEIELTASQPLLEALRLLTEAVSGGAPAVANAAVRVTKRIAGAERASGTGGTEGTGGTGGTEGTGGTAKAVEPEGAAGEAEAPAATGFTLEQVRAEASAKALAGKREAVKRLVRESGASSVPAMDASHYAEFMSRLKEL